MSKPEWGIKRVCPSCSIKYYDFNKNPIICPKCEFEFDPDLLLKSRKGRSIAIKSEDNTFSNDTKKGSLLKFWNLQNSFRLERLFKSLK